MRPENQGCYCTSTDCRHMVLLLCNMLVARINWRMNPVSPVKLSGCSQTTVTSYIMHCKYCLSQTALWYPLNLFIMILCHFQAVLICWVGASIHEACSIIEVHQGIKIIWNVIATLIVPHLFHEMRLVFRLSVNRLLHLPYLDVTVKIPLW
jgi:hypothetical protein